MSHDLCGLREQTIANAKAIAVPTGCSYRELDIFVLYDKNIDRSTQDAATAYLLLNGKPFRQGRTLTSYHSALLSLLEVTMEELEMVGLVGLK
jgi:hypothetical protein